MPNQALSTKRDGISRFRMAAVKKRGEYIRLGLMGPRRRPDLAKRAHASGYWWIADGIGGTETIADRAPAMFPVCANAAHLPALVRNGRVEGQPGNWRPAANEQQEYLVGKLSLVGAAARAIFDL